MAHTKFEPKGTFYVRQIPETMNRDYDHDESPEVLPSDWFATRAEAEANATQQAQKDRHLRTYAVMVPVWSVTQTPPEVTSVKLD